MGKKSVDDLSAEYMRSLGKDMSKVTRSDDRAFRNVKENNDYHRIRAQVLKDLGVFVGKAR